MSLNVSAYSIKNPLVAILLFVLLTLGGIYGFMKMKVQQFPDIDLPAVVVTVTLPGAAPSQLENDIAKKVENKLPVLKASNISERRYKRARPPWSLSLS